MAKPIVFVIHSLDSSLASLSKLLEARDFSVHMSRSLAEAERVYSAFPIAQVKFIFADVTVCCGDSGRRFEERVRAAPPDTVIVGYHPRHTQQLHALLGHPSLSADEGRAANSPKNPEMIGEAPQFRDTLHLTSRYA